MPRVSGQPFAETAILGDVFHSTPVIVGPPTTLLLGGSRAMPDFVTAWAGRQRVLYAGANDGDVPRVRCGIAHEWETTR